MSISLDPEFAEAYRNLSKIKTFKNNDKHIPQMKKLFDKKDTSLSDKARLGFALSKVHQDLGNLDEILSIYPDACFIHIHRDPAETIPSICSLTSQVRKGFTDSIDLNELGKTTLDFWGNSKKRNEAQKSNLNNDQYIDIYYEDFINDPLKTIENIYTKFNFSFDKKNKALTESYIEKSDKIQKEKHIYTLQEYGLDKKEVHNRLKIK